MTAASMGANHGGGPAGEKAGAVMRGTPLTAECHGQLVCPWLDFTVSKAGASNHGQQAARGTHGEDGGNSTTIPKIRASAKYFSFIVYGRLIYSSSD
jgi:hypothetical protein